MKFPISQEIVVLRKNLGGDLHFFPMGGWVFRGGAEKFLLHRGLAEPLGGLQNLGGLRPC